MKTDFFIVFLVGIVSGLLLGIYIDSLRPGKVFFYKAQWDNCLIQHEKEMTPEPGKTKKDD